MESLLCSFFMFFHKCINVSAIIYSIFLCIFICTTPLNTHPNCVCNLFCIWVKMFVENMRNCFWLKVFLCFVYFWTLENVYFEIKVFPAFSFHLSDDACWWNVWRIILWLLSRILVSFNHLMFVIDDFYFNNKHN